MYSHYRGESREDIIIIFVNDNNEFELNFQFQIRDTIYLGLIYIFFLLYTMWKIITRYIALAKKSNNIIIFHRFWIVFCQLSFFIVFICCKGWHHDKDDDNDDDDEEEEEDLKKKEFNVLYYSIINSIAAYTHANKHISIFLHAADFSCIGNSLHIKSLL